MGSPPEVNPLLTHHAMPLTLASFNLRNLVRPGVLLYDDFEPYTLAEYHVKIAALTGAIQRTGADVVGLQEIGDRDSFADLAARLSADYPHSALGQPGRAEPAVRVGLLSRWPVTRSRTLTAIPPSDRVTLEEAPETVLLTAFSRPILHAEIQLTPDRPMDFFVLHLKSRRARLFEGEDREDETHQVRGQTRALMIRGLEAAAFRLYLSRYIREEGREWVAVVGDLNDEPDDVTTRLIQGWPGDENPAGLFSCLALERALRPDHQPYSYIGRSRPVMLDHILVSAPLARRFQYFRAYSDHLPDAKADRTLSDHALIAATFGGDL